MDIFVSIASYRDPELSATIADCLAKARHPERLRFGVCWQHGPEEPAPEIFADARFHILDVDWRESRGACWARAEIMKLWRGEEWYLQLDSHHRFAQDWDEKLLAQARACGSQRPVLTTYAAPYEPVSSKPLSNEPMLMAFDYFNDGGVPLFRPAAIPPEALARGPVPSRFLSAHFLFAPGSFVEDVPYDPELYFIGEEISLALRAFTHGYDLFHPAESILWHQYNRWEQSPTHWNDHRPENGVARAWHEFEGPSGEKVKRLLAGEDVGLHGCGSVRSLADYEAYAGVSFAHRRVQDYTRLCRIPPNPPQKPGWQERMHEIVLRVSFPAERLPEGAGEAICWYVGAHDAQGREIFREDADAAEIRRLLAGDPGEVTLTRRFATALAPISWKLMVLGRDGAWRSGCELSGPIGAESRQEEFRPRAIAELSYAEADGGFIVTLSGDARRRCFLNPTGALLLEFANGRHTLPEIVDAVAEIYGLSDTPERAVRAFFADAAQRGLIEADAYGASHG